MLRSIGEFVLVERSFLLSDDVQVGWTDGAKALSPSGGFQLSWTALIFPEAFEGVERTINQPFSVHRFRVRANSSQIPMIASCGWHEEVPGFAFRTHQLDLILDFEAQPNGRIFLCAHREFIALIPTAAAAAHALARKNQQD